MNSAERKIKRKRKEKEWGGSGGGVVGDGEEAHTKSHKAGTEGTETHIASPRRALQPGDMKKWVAVVLLLCASLAAVGADSLSETRKKAEKGDAAAQCSLGLMYDNGKGVPKDYAEAVKWFRKSAEQGYAAAQFNLGLCYRYGEGVPKDIVQAHAWLNIAGAKGNETAKNLLAIIEKEEMTDSQKEKAMDLARQIFARLEKK